MVQLATSHTPLEAPWAHLIAAEQWKIYSAIMTKAQQRKITFAVGGGTAFSHYSHRWRDSKDLDLYVLPTDREKLIQVTKDLGMVDYFAVHDYDRAWIYRSHDNAGTIVDIIWKMANGRAEVDEAWLTRGELLRVNELTVRMLPAEELLWGKLYILQRDRCDWGDLLNILYTSGDNFDWDHLLNRVEDDWRVLAALLDVFAWLCPGRANRFPTWLWRRVHLTPPPKHMGPDVDPGRVRVLDSRDWFGPNQPEEQVAGAGPLRQEC